RGGPPPPPVRRSARSSRSRWRRTVRDRRARDSARRHRRGRSRVGPRPGHCAWLSVMAPQAPQALEGLKVVDCATLLAGPLIATLLADYGADVVKVEHPAGDSLRGFRWTKDGVSLWWLFVNRNNACVSLSLSAPAGAALLKELVADADVLVENFRPGTMERWGLGWEELSAVNPRLVMVRVTGFGQTGPYAGRPG